LTALARPEEALRWTTSENAGDLPSATSAEPGARWDKVPELLDKARKFKSLEKAFADHLYRNARLVLLENPKLGLVSAPGEDVMAFRDRCRSDAQQEAAKALAVKKREYEPKFLALGVALPEGHVREEESLLDSINPLNWFRSAPGPNDNDKVNKLHEEWLIKQASVIAEWKKIGEEYAEKTLSPRRQDVQVIHFGVAWAPFWQVTNADRSELVPAHCQG
jgi:hypothetical protein